MANEKYVMMSDNPTGTGSFSLNRKADTTIEINSFAEGNNTTASGFASHAEGDGTTASNDSSHAEGQSTTASGDYSHAEGGYTTATGTASHASGNGTIASGEFSTATGFATQATGLHSFTGGLNSIASQQCSFAYGNNVTSSYANKAVFGIYNNDKSDTLFEVGIGTSSTDKKNAFEVVNDGTIRTLNGIFSKLSDNYSILDGNADEGVGASNFALHTAYTELLTKIESGGGGGQANVQSDWAETNTESDSYIKNKPTNLLYNSDSNLAVVDTTGDDTKNDVTTFTSEDSTTAESWTDVEVLSSGEKHSSLWKKVSIMFKNIRYLKNFLGNNDISAIGDGTVTSGISTLNDNLTTKLVSGFGSSIAVDGGTFDYLTAYRVGNIIFVYGSYKITKSVGNYIDIFQIKDAYLPTLDVEGACARSNDATYRRFTIYKNGLVRLQPRGDASGVYYFNANYSI